VTATDESSLTVRVKYMVKPGDVAFMIRRVAYEKILKMFKASGIEFASRRVEVYVPHSEGLDAKQIAAAALPAIEAQELEDKGKAK
jgi:small-conductance mechanosensitive channel